MCMFSVVFMLVLAGFDTIEYSLLETSVPLCYGFHDTTLSLAPASLARQIFVCFPVSLCFPVLLNIVVAWGPTPSLLLFSIQLAFLQDQTSIFELQCKCWWFPSLHLQLSPILACIPDPNSCLSVRYLHHSILQHLEPWEMLTELIILCPSATCACACISNLSTCHYYSVFRNWRMNSVCLSTAQSRFW